MKPKPKRWHRYRSRAGKRKAWIINEINIRTHAFFSKNQKKINELIFAPNPFYEQMVKE